MERGWIQKISAFLSTDEEKIVQYLMNIGFNVKTNQVDAWYDCIAFLKVELEKLTTFQKDATIIFEYKLENGIRPDVLILTKTDLLILEFKSGESAANYTSAHRSQVENYAMRFECYHKYTYENELSVKRYIVYTHPSIQLSETNILLKDNFIQVINGEIKDTLSDNEVEEWINSNYQAIPDILKGVDLVFNPKDLPHIMSSKSNIEKVLVSIKDIIESNDNVSLNIILVSGDPGAGKTLLGLKTVKDFIWKYEKNTVAAYLSGNAPLVKVLRFQVDEACNRGKKQSKPYGEAYIKSVNNYINPFVNSLKGKNIFEPIKESVLVFDEAQRAWNKDQMKKKYGINASQSEVMLYSLIKSVNELKSSKTLICLVGDGQEIYLGEEDGIENWVSALKRFNDKVKRLNIYAPPKYQEFLEGFNSTFIEDLYLNAYLRGHGADMFPQWIESILINDSNRARELLKRIYKEQKYYSIFITRSLKSAHLHFEQQVDESLQTYGVVTSSFAQYELEEKNGLTPVAGDKLGLWYTEVCRTFEQYVTEFDSQGLEIDFSVVSWGVDFIRKNGDWKRNKTLRKTQAGKWYDGLKSFKNPLQILKNIYRVILTRGRNGLIIYIPEDPLLNETYDYFVNEIGVTEIN